MNGNTLPRATTPPSIVWECSAVGLAPGLLDALQRAADRYAGATGQALTVVSGRRTLRRQAELMAGMTREQLQGMYCRNGYPDYVRGLVALQAERGTVTPEDAYRILGARRDGYVSAHLSGAAVDIAAERVDAAVARSALEAEGFRVLDERALGIACLHATHVATPLAIVRE